MVKCEAKGCSGHVYKNANNDPYGSKVLLCNYHREILECKIDGVYVEDD